MGHVTLNISNDGLVYVADRRADRVDVTTKEGELLKEFLVAPWTPSNRGSAGGVAFSADPEQQYLIITDMASILKTYRIPITAIEEGKPIQKVIEEVGLVIDDQLPGIPSLYREWRTAHGR